ncbi:MAG: hypothetical protein K2K53_08060 [Oscillospiraceae bacterium]|nr:hypothetical protein [Oscillospiraceae bacterium]
MNSIQEQAIQAIEAQQKKVPARSAPWMVGEQLKDICRLEPLSAELIAQDLQNQAMGISQAEKKIKAFADGHKTESFSCVTPIEANRILREFYGLPLAGEGAGAETEAPAPAPVPSGRINALDYL